MENYRGNTGKNIPETEETPNLRLENLRHLEKLYGTSFSDITRLLRNSKIPFKVIYSDIHKGKGFEWCIKLRSRYNSKLTKEFGIKSPIRRYTAYYQIPTNEDLKEIEQKFIVKDGKIAEYTYINLFP